MIHYQSCSLVGVLAPHSGRVHLNVRHSHSFPHHHLHCLPATAKTTGWRCAPSMEAGRSFVICPHSTAPISHQPLLLPTHSLCADSSIKAPHSALPIGRLPNLCLRHPNNNNPYTKVSRALGRSGADRRFALPPSRTREQRQHPICL